MHLRFLSSGLRLTGVCLLAMVASMPLHGQTISSYYTIESVPTPAGVAPLLGGIDFAPSGRLFACFHHGEVAAMEPGTRQWTRFAEGLHEPLGIIAVSDTQVIVGQRPEVTRIIDTDHDGRADVYENVFDAFGMSRNYHEFTFGPVRDREGNLFFATSCASSGAGASYELRGKYNPDGRDPFQDYSPVPYRGWVWKLSPAGVATPFASGLRQPNGLGFDLDGNLFAGDNQGSFIGSSKLLHVQQSKFHGMIMSRVWEPGWPGGNPLSYPVETHDKQRVREAVMFPHGSMANSPTQILVDASGGKFGPFAGQLLVGEMNRPRIVRVALERIGGELQGLAVPFFDADGLKMGNVRMAWAPDGSLYVAQTMRQGWAGDTGLQRIAWTGKTPPEVQAMNVTDRGFDLTFTVPVDPSTATRPEAYAFRRSYYRYHRRYDPRQFDVHDVPVKSVKLSPDARRVSLELAEMVPGRVYELNLHGIKAADGSPIVNAYMAYTLNRLKDGAPGYQPPAHIVEVLPATLTASRSQEIVGQRDRDSVKLPATGGNIETWAHMPAQGMHTVTIRYAVDGPGDSTVRWTVNGKNVGAPRIFKTTHGAWGTMTVNAIFDQGDNAFGLHTLGKGGIKVASFEIKPAE